MTGPPTPLLLVGYAAVGGVGAAFVATRSPKQMLEAVEAAATVVSNTAEATVTGVRVEDLAAADAWRKAAAAELSKLQAATAKREAEAKWYADYQGALRQRAAMQVQLARSAELQVQRNKAVSARSKQDAFDQDVAAPKRKGAVRRFFGKLFGRK